MIYLELFLVFLKIGLFTIGGGYAMLPMIREEVVGRSWLSEARLSDMIAVSESTPGPIAINMATFVGSSQGGILGSACATLGVVLPSFVIILIIAALFKNFKNNRFVRGFMDGVKPVIFGMILFMGLLLAVKAFLPNIMTFDLSGFDWKALVIFSVLAVTSIIYSKLKKKRFSPILLILISAGLGIVFYYLI